MSDKKMHLFLMCFLTGAFTASDRPLRLHVATIWGHQTSADGPNLRNRH